MTLTLSDSLLTTNFYPSIIWPHQTTFANDSGELSATFVQRLCASYRHQISSPKGPGYALWANLHAKSADVHKALLHDDMATVHSIIQNPSTTNLFYGFESVVAESIQIYLKSPELLCEDTPTVCDRILRLAEALGSLRLYNPEALLHRREALDIEQVLSGIETKLAGPLIFPNPFPNEFGLQTSRGVVSYRAVQAVYQAWRLKELSIIFGDRIIEIGAGLGRNAYYARAMGLPNYTIIDLPLAIVAQAIFLARVLGEAAVTLPGEKPSQGSVRLETPAWYLEQKPRCDIVANIDSMAEMAQEFAEQYVAVAAKKASIILSINHEYNPVKVGDLPTLQKLPKLRYPYWMRKGYAEEIYFCPRSKATGWRARIFGTLHRRDHPLLG